jgi:hypothetical protein
MLGEFGDDLKEFDVTRPFVITRHSSKPVSKAKRLVLNQRTEREYDFDSILKNFHKSHSEAYSEESMQRSTSRVVQDQDDYQNFYLKYLEYFVGLLVRYSSPKNNFKTHKEIQEGKKMEELEKKIRCTVIELLNKYVRVILRVEYIM